MPDREKVIKGIECHRKKVHTKNAISCLLKCPYSEPNPIKEWCISGLMDDIYALLKEQIPDSSKYQYKYDHTDCIWYHDSRSKCPVTCSQYRDGWNDAMDYIFKDGKGYSPYERR